MLQNAPSIKLPHCFKIFILFIFEWPLKTGFAICKPNIEESHVVPAVNGAVFRTSSSELNYFHFLAR